MAERKRVESGTDSYLKQTVSIQYKELDMGFASMYEDIVDRSLNSSIRSSRIQSPVRNQSSGLNTDRNKSPSWFNQIERRLEKINSARETIRSANMEILSAYGTIRVARTKIKTAGEKINMIDNPNKGFFKFIRKFRVKSEIHSATSEIDSANTMIDSANQSILNAHLEISTAVAEIQSESETLGMLLNRLVGCR